MVSEVELAAASMKLVVLGVSGLRDVAVDALMKGI